MKIDFMIFDSKNFLDCAGFGGKMLKVNEVMKGPDGSSISCTIEQGQVVRTIHAAPSAEAKGSKWIVGDVVYGMGGDGVSVPIGWFLS